MTFPNARAAMPFYSSNALIDTQYFCNLLGKQITIKLHTDATINKDSYGSIKSKQVNPGLTFYSYPLTYSPSQKQWEEAGLHEKVDVMIKTAMKTWNDYGYTMERLQSLDMIRAEIIIDGQRFEIKDKVLESQFFTTYLYVLIGANKI